MACKATAAGLALTFSLSALAAAERPSPGALRDPAAVHDRLRAICEDAGFRQTGYRDCAKSMGAACVRAKIDPGSARCWQWVVDRDTNGQLDRRSLGMQQRTKEKQ